MTTTLTPIEGGLSVIGSPQQILKQHQEVANLLMDFVLKQNLFQQIGKNRHIYIEAWQFCGHFYGITAKERQTDPYVDELTGAAGFKSTADIVLINKDQVISSASALCLNNEDNWNVRPKYEWKNGDRQQIGEVRVPSQQLASMAQTRAMSKALSNVLRFVVVLAGFSTTPAEEMTGDEQDHRREEKQNGRDPERKSTANGPANNGLINDKQRSLLFARGKAAGIPMNELAKCWQAEGFDIAAQITRDKFDAVLKRIAEWKAA